MAGAGTAAGVSGWCDPPLQLTNSAESATVTTLASNRTIGDLQAFLRY